MLGMFESEVRRLDPDVMVCHDGSKILDTLIQRIYKLGGESNRHSKPMLGRLSHGHEFSKHNQHQRISGSLAGRLVCDTFIHAKDMIRSVDYELESMVGHIKPSRAFKGMNDEEALTSLNDNRAFSVVKKLGEETEMTMALMNHL